MSAPDLPLGIAISYRQQYRRCGKAGCSRCAGGGPGHGPYWYAFWSEGGRMHSRYVGKQQPAGMVPAPAPVPVLTRAAPALTVVPAPVPTPAPTPAPVALLRVQTLGGFAVWRGEAPISSEAWTSQRARALFSCLLAAPGYRLHREQVIELLWPDAAPEAGASNLRTTVHLLRRVLDVPGAPRSYLRTQGDVLALVPGDEVVSPDADWFDATAFARLAVVALARQDAAACRAALARYTGDYLPDEPYAAWTEPLRTTLRQQYLDLLLHLAQLSGSRGEVEEAEGCLRRVLASEPGHEEAAATLMGLLAASGRRSEALRVYQALATALEEELGVAPSAEVAALRARLVAQEAAPLAVRLPVRNVEPKRPSNLPLALTSFVGRGWEIRAVAEALTTARLLTLTGPGGCGKTRLALEATARLAETDAYPDGVWLVELAALADPRLVPRAIAGALGLVEHASRSVQDALQDFLRSRHLLLVLDNCEHLVATCAEVATLLLQTCPHLRVLATSREPLAVAGEQIYLVLPLAVPDPAALPSLEQLGAYEAVQLFLQRAQARRPELTLTAANAEAVATICARLDGLPLAIELAAARVGVLPVEGIAARLDDRFRLLTGGPRTALPRQQTLRATLDWSYRLLAPNEQTLLARLAVFAGGCTLEAAGAVCGAPEEPEHALLDSLTSLADKGLLRSIDAADGLPRFAMLETIRAYGLERLTERDMAMAIRGRHALYYLALAEQAEAQHWGPRQRLWLDRVETDHDNIRAALRWLLDHGDGASCLRFGFAMWRLWMLHSHLREGSRWLEEILVRGDETPLLRAKALYGAGVLAYRRCDYAQARTLQEESLTLFRSSGDRWGMARTLNQLANVALNAAAYEPARTRYGESLQLAREIGDTWMEATVLNNLGLVALYVRDYAEAQAVYEASLALRRQGGDPWAVAESLVGLARVMLQQEDARRAAALLRESVALLHAVGDKRALADGLEALAAAIGLLGQPEQAARLWGAAESLRSASGAPLDASDRARNERCLAAVRSQVDRAAWRAAWNAGRTMPLERVIAAEGQD